eukprot:CAMPEP_0171167078 /NCGR_PEP_ID=MMETSP0790-20130122/7020_1 /TAXON_ID=2925 /ORGANISM="Alexandrium catenella, Strain OF101" /LENGTH=108 /DNA_ID=CAMNT_0011631897 /DNA_START=72 /DNA_END=394 /DNA_ORIENTATION=-
MRPAVLTALLSGLAVVAGAAECEGACPQRGNEAAEPVAPTGISMLQLLSTKGKATPETHLDPLNVENATLDKPRYAEDWRTEWKPDPNASRANRTHMTTTFVPFSNPR